MASGRVRWALSLTVACGGSRPAADPTPQSAPPPAAKPAVTRPADAEPAVARPAGVEPAVAKPADAKPADARPATPRDERLEDKRTEKPTGTAGSYKTDVLSAAGLDPAGVGGALGAVAAKLDGCYSSYLSRRPPPGLHTSYDVVVDPGGKTQAVKLRADDTKNPELHKCLEAALKAVAWPRPTEKVGKTTVEWTLGT